MSSQPPTHFIHSVRCRRSARSDAGPRGGCGNIEIVSLSRSLFLATSCRARLSPHAATRGYTTSRGAPVVYGALRRARRAAAARGAADGATERLVALSARRRRAIRAQGLAVALRDACSLPGSCPHAGEGARSRRKARALPAAAARTPAASHTASAARPERRLARTRSASAAAIASASHPAAAAIESEAGAPAHAAPARDV